MVQRKVTFNDSLQKMIISTGKCSACAACVVACPFHCLEYNQKEPRLADDCKACGVCADVCPRFKRPSSEVQGNVFGRDRNRAEEFGVYRQIVAARATDANVLAVCQDGGVVTALMLHALKTGLIDAAVLSGITRQKPFCPVPTLAETAKQILRCAGTRYSYSPNLLALLTATRQKRIAFVGTPCQIEALRLMQMRRLKITSNVKLLVGLMCSECFTYEGLVEKHIHSNLGVSLKNISSINIKGKMIVKLKSGSLASIPLVDAKKYARKTCTFCKDFSSELADISVGGLGLKGWTLVVLRTKEGESLFKSAAEAGILTTKNVKREDPAYGLLVKLSNKKKLLDV